MKRNFTGITSLLPKPLSSMLSYCAKGINKFTAVNRVGAFWRPANCECQLSCSAFNKFTHSNRPAAVQHPFWGDVSPLTPDAVGSAPFSFPPERPLGLAGHPEPHLGPTNPHLLPWRIHNTHSPESDADLTQEPGRNRAAKPTRT